VTRTQSWLQSRSRMGPPPRSLAAEANGCLMVRVRHGPNRIQGCGASDPPDSGLPSDQSKHAFDHRRTSHAIKLGTDIPIQGCVKTSGVFTRACFVRFWEALKRSASKIAKNFALLNRLQNFAEFPHSLGRSFALSRLAFRAQGRASRPDYRPSSGEVAVSAAGYGGWVGVRRLRFLAAI
jgi:hypothetical protein